MKYAVFACTNCANKIPVPIDEGAEVPRTCNRCEGDVSPHILEVHGTKENLTVTDELDREYDPEEMMALNQITGRVHKYNGTMLGGINKEDHDHNIGIIPCGCEEFEEAIKTDNLIMIERKHLERGIWEPAECVNEG